MSTIPRSLGLTHIELEFLHSQNALLTQQLDDYTSSTLDAVSQSFENGLDQAKHFHHPLTLSRE